VSKNYVPGLEARYYEAFNPLHWFLHDVMLVVLQLP